jgi:hypothetical protein
MAEQTRKDSSFWKWLAVPAMVVAIFALWDRFSKPTQLLTVWGNDYGFFVPYNIPMSGADFNAAATPADSTTKNEAAILQKIAHSKKYLVISITNTSRAAVKDVRLMVNADTATVYTVRQKEKVIVEPTEGADKIPIGTIDVGEQYVVHVWCSPAPSQTEKFTVVYDGGVAEYHPHATDSFAFIGIPVLVLIVLGLGMGVGVFIGNLYVEKRVFNGVLDRLLSMSKDDWQNVVAKYEALKAAEQAKEQPPRPLSGPQG